jgi:hypothetical protein
LTSYNNALYNNRYNIGCKVEGQYLKISVRKAKRAGTKARPVAIVFSG